VRAGRTCFNPASIVVERRKKRSKCPETSTSALPKDENIPGQLLDCAEMEELWTLELFCWYDAENSFSHDSNVFCIVKESGAQSFTLGQPKVGAHALKNPLLLRREIDFDDFSRHSTTP
jgi:hypothetical protein